MPSAASGCDRGSHSLRCGGRQLSLPQSIFTCRSLRVYDVWLLHSSSHDRVCIADRAVAENHCGRSSRASEDTVGVSVAGVLLYPHHCLITASHHVGSPGCVPCLSFPLVPPIGL
uniref:Uncharacterized protein n=1 Tax=Avian adenovirus 8 (strain ATCC A-2A) TaxID=66295 RepID=Q96736_ADEG8|nr:unknown [Fowl aviadenovirus 8]AAF17341.1 unknown [Fowl aviadenovirus 8]